MQELVSRVQQAEARAGQAEQQAQRTQQVLAQMQQQQQQRGQTKGGNGRGFESGIGSFASKYQPPSFEGEDDKWKEWARVFRSLSGRFYDGELSTLNPDATNQPESVTLPLSLVSGMEEKLRAMASELYHVLVMLTRGRAQKLVLKAGEPEGFEAYRLLLRRYEPQTTATTATKLVELLSTQFAGDLLDCVTDFERRVAGWESEAGEQVSDLIKIGVVINGLEKGNFQDHLLINTSGMKQWSRFIREIEAVELARLNSRPTPMDLSAVGHDKPKRFEGGCSVRMAARLEIAGRKQPPSLRVAKVSSPGTPPSGLSGEREEARTEEEEEAKARAKTKAKEKERKDRKDSTKWRIRAVSRKVTARSGTRTRTYGMKTVAQEGPSGMKASGTCMTRTVLPGRHRTSG